MNSFIRTVKPRIIRKALNTIVNFSGAHVNYKFKEFKYVIRCWVNWAIPTLSQCNEDCDKISRAIIKWIQNIARNQKDKYIKAVSIISFSGHRDIYSFSLLRKRTARKPLTWRTTKVNEFYKFITIITVKYIASLKLWSPFHIAYYGSE